MSKYEKEEGETEEEYDDQNVYYWLYLVQGTGYERNRRLVYEQ